MKRSVLPPILGRFERVRNVLPRLGARDRTHAAMVGFRRGIIKR